MASEWAIICKLGGYINSNPEIISSYPNLDISLEESMELLSKCLPVGAKVGDFITDKYKKYNLLSYIFKVVQHSDRDDLLSFSILLNKKDKAEIYKPILRGLMNSLDSNGLLNEKILKMYQEVIYKGINSEKDITIENVLIDFSKIFKEVKSQLIKLKPNLKGSFF